MMQENVAHAYLANQAIIEHIADSYMSLKQKVNEGVQQHSFSTIATAAREFAELENLTYFSGSAQNVLDTLNPEDVAAVGRFKGMLTAVIQDVQDKNVHDHYQNLLTLLEAR